MAADLKREFEYFLEHHEELLSKYAGKVIAKGQQVPGVYDNEVEAIRETAKSSTLGTFIVQRCTPGQTDISQTFHLGLRFE